MSDQLACSVEVEIEPRYTSVEVMRILRASGIRTSRERVNMMTDDLFGREEPGTHRRIGVAELAIIREAFSLVDQVKVPRRIVPALYTDTNDSIDILHARVKQSEKALDTAMATVRAAREQFQNTDNTDERIKAARRIRDAVRTIERVRRLIAA